MDGCGVKGQYEMRSVVRSGSRKNECVPRARGGRGKGAGGPLLSLLLKKDMVDSRVRVCGCGVSVSGCVDGCFGEEYSVVRGVLISCSDLG